MRTTPRKYSQQVLFKNLLFELLQYVSDRRCVQFEKLIFKQVRTFKLSKKPPIIKRGLLSAHSTKYGKQNFAKTYQQIFAKRVYQHVQLA
jgi:hypothetical protein